MKNQKIRRLRWALAKGIDFLFPRRRSAEKIENLTVEFLTQKIWLKEGAGGVTSLLEYRDPTIQNLIWELKYQGSKKAAALCGELLLNEIMVDISEIQAFSDLGLPLLVPIPLSAKRRKERGFNQSELLCEVICEKAGTETFEYRSGLLSKIRDSASQTSLKSRSERLKNLQGCFGVKNPEKVKGRVVIVIDDITTTGATFAEAREVLETAGAKEIICYSVAH